MVGPVFYQEMVLGARRGRWHWIRWLYAGWLVVELFFWLFFYLIAVSAMDRRPANASDMAAFAREQYVPFCTYQHFLLIAIITPVLAAGAITDEKASGTLQYLLTADLLPGEVLIGKLIARVYQAILLGVIGLPLFCLIGAFGGMGVFKLLGFVFCTALMIFSLGSLSMLCSVWCRHTRDAVLTMYSLLLAVWLSWWLPQYFWPISTWPQWLTDGWRIFNPVCPLGQYWMTLPIEEYGKRLLYFTLFWGGIGFGCLLVSVWQIRRAYVRQLESSGKKSLFRFLHFGRPSIGKSPITWKERHVEGVAPLAFLRQFPTWFGVIFVFVLTTVSCIIILALNLPPGHTWDSVLGMVLRGDLDGFMEVRENMGRTAHIFYYFGWFIILLVCFVIGIRCSGAVTGEREKKTWEALLLTPLETKQLIRGKMWGIAGACLPYMAAYIAPALFFSLIGGSEDFFWVLLWFGVTLLGIFYAGTAGIYWSVKSSTSWRSLFMTIVFIYGGGFVLFLCLFIFAVFLGLFIVLFLSLVDALMQQYFGVTLSLARGAAAFGNGWAIGMNILLTVSFFFISWMFLRRAEYRVGMLERVKHWRNEPRRQQIYRPRRVEHHEEDRYRQGHWEEYE